MTHTFSYLIAPESSGQTIETFLKNQGYSKHLIIQLRKTDTGIMLDGVHAYTTRRLETGSRLTIRLEETTGSEQIVPTPMPLDIVFEDEHLMVINKAAKVPVHPSQGNYEGTLANGIAYYFKEQGTPFVFRVVNRLDRDTTGLLVLAKHGLSSCILSGQIKNRIIKRTYLAVVSGFIAPGAWHTITAPIARKDGSTIERCVDYDHGEYACTHYSALHYHEAFDCSLVTLRLDTGRTHQIRVHMKELGHPLLGDFLYNPDYRLIARQSLHSWKLEFLHPVTGKLLSFTAPVPDDFPLRI